jgi:hypothetical protein
MDRDIQYVLNFPRQNMIVTPKIAAAFALTFPTAKRAVSNGKCKKMFVVCA